MKRLLLFCLLLLLPMTALADLEVRFLDVGHGDCAVILCDGEAMVIDGGDERNSDKLYTVIKDLGVTELKYAVATHPQTDHVGGLTAIFYASTVRALYTPVLEYSTDRFEMLMDKAALNSVPVIVPSPGDTLALGGAVITILSPVGEYKNANDMSIVLRLDYGERSFLFTGDAGKSVEKALLTAAAALDADVLKVAHHGSSSATSAEFVQAVSPDYAVISCYLRYDNPDAEVLDTLLAADGTQILRTDVNGDILVSTDGREIYVSSEYAYVANTSTEVFHRDYCPSAAKMADEHRKIYFISEQAERDGYRPCKNCSP